MARPKLIDPCARKGRYLGSRGRGRSYSAIDPETGKKFRHNGCECSQAFVCSSSKSQIKKLRYGVDALGETKMLDTSVSTPNDVLEVVPCEGTFLKRGSEGTLRHRRSCGSATTFRGCFDLERELFSANLIKYEFREDLGRSLDVNERTEILGISNDYAELDEESLLEFFVDGTREQIDTKQMDISRLEAMDWDEKIKADKTFHKQVPMSSNEPLTPTEDKPPLFKGLELEELLAMLTTKQRNAVEAVLLYNHEGLTQEAMAKSMKISRDSLRERIAGALKKLNKALEKRPAPEEAEDAS